MGVNYKAYVDANGDVVRVLEGSTDDISYGTDPNTIRVPALDKVTSNDGNTDESIVPDHTHVAAEITDFDTEVSNNASVTANTAKRTYPLADENKLATIEANAKDDQNADEVPFDNSGTNLSGSDVDAVIKELDTRTSPGGGLDHGGLAGLTDDDHPQYLNISRGDDRYYTETELDNGQLDNRYYTETELNNGALDTRYYTETELLTGGALDPRYYTEVELNAGQLDTRYYTKSELNAGQLDTRYYTEAEIDTLLNAKQSISEKNQANGYAGLDGNAKLPTSLLPALAISETFVVADIAARDALTIGSGDGEVQRGDVAVVGDASADPGVDSGGASYIYDGSAWQRLLTPEDSVLSVNGQTGIVVLDTGDIAEGSNLYYTEARVSANVDVAANTAHRNITSGNPHGTTISDTISADPGTDISVGELETLSDGSDASGLHNHDTDYYTKTELDSGQLDNQYYTETELDNGQLDNRYYTETELDAGQLDNRYYTETELDGGQLDTRYYTEAEIDAQLAPLVTGPGSAIDSNIALFDSTTGKLIKDDGFSIIDEDDMASDSALAVPTQQSTKSYVDAGRQWTVVQNGHGFSLTNNIPIPAYVSGGNYIAAQADDLNTLSAVYVTEVIDANTIIVRQSGIHKAPSHGLTVGQYYFLSDSTAGAVTSVDPLNDISDVVFYVVDTDTILLIDNRPVDNESLQKYLIKTTNTDTTTNINQATYTAVPLMGTTEVNENSYFTVVGNSIQIDTTRSYNLRVNVHYTSTGARVALQGRFFVNGSPVGAVTSCGYVRASNGHNEASLHLTESFSLSAGDTVEFRVQRESTLATATTLALSGSSNLMIEAR